MEKQINIGKKKTQTQSKQINEERKKERKRKKAILGAWKDGQGICICL